jgi:hypothetical protein
MKYLRVLACAASVMISTVQAANTLLTNPAGFAYDDSITNVPLYGQPTGLLIAGPCNYSFTNFQNARANGAEVLAYLNAVDYPDGTPPACVQGLYQGSGNLWPFPTYGQRVNWAGRHIADIRVGSAWSNHVVAYIEQLMTAGQVDGVFLDVLGARLWSALADWNSWPQAEKDAYTSGANDLVRRIDARRRAINPNFIVVNNNNWDRGSETDPLNHVGEQYVDGICIENHFATEQFQIDYAARPFGGPGHRRVIAIGKNSADAQAWKDVQGITHVADPNGDYVHASPPPIPFNRLTDRPYIFGKATIGTGMSTLDGDFKRASKFTLARDGRLVALHAYLDGGGSGPGASQDIRLSLYRDNAGVPGTKVVDSTPKTITAGATVGWQKFTVSNVPLTAGTYWIAIHTGMPELIIRVGREAPANWYGANDLYSDGAANPYGAGFTGTTTLSVYATYTLE